MAGNVVHNPAMLSLAALATVFLFLTGRVIYNIFFHPLRRFPGPKLWQTSYIFRHVAAMRGQLDWSMKAFHEKYGPVVRYSPTELSFISDQAWKDIYGHKAAPMVKDLQWYGVASAAHSIFNSNHATHARIKRQLAHAFSERALREQEPKILAYIDMLVRKIKEKAISAPDGAELDMVQWYNFMTFDLVGDLALGQDFGCMEAGRPHGWITNLFQAIKIGPFMRFIATYTDLRRAMRWFAPKSIAIARAKHEAYVREAVRQRLDQGIMDERKDFVSYILKNREGKAAFTNDEIVANCGFLLLAGSETTATLMSGLTYHLCANPEILRKLTDEIRGAFDSEADIDFTAAAERLPYTQACIDEALRLYPPAPNIFPRVTGREGQPTIIDGFEVSPVATVGVHALSASRSATNFHRPDDFIPERWLAAFASERGDDDTREHEARHAQVSRENDVGGGVKASAPFETDKRGASQPFSLGAYGCLGKTLAKNQLRAMVARILWNFDLELTEGSRGWDRQLTFTFWEKPPLMCRVRTGQPAA